MNAMAARSGSSAPPIRAEWLKWAIALTVSFAAILQIIDISIVNVALPQMQGNLGATVSEIGWVITGYSIANAIVIPLTAFLGGAFGQKQYFIFSLLAFVLASFMCGLATTLPMLIFARVLQGLFGGGLLPRAQSILFETFPPEQYGIAQAVFGIGVIVGPTFAPTLGGYLTDTLGWRWIFFINLPIGAFAVLMAMVFLPQSTPNKAIRSRIDWIGIGLLAVWLGSLQTFLEEGQTDGWFQSDFITGLAITMVVGLGLFLWRELKTELPAVDLRVLKHKELAAGSMYSVVMGITLFGTIFVIPLFTQNILGFSAIQSGELLIPGALASAVMMPFVGMALSRTDARLSITVSSFAVAISMFMLADMNIFSGYWSFFWPLLLRGLGMGFSFAPLSVATLGNLPKKDLPAGTGLVQPFPSDRRKHRSRADGDHP